MKKRELRKIKKTKEFKTVYNIELEKLEYMFDKRDRVYRMLEDWKFKHGEIPVDYIGQWTAYVTDGRYLIKYKKVKKEKIALSWKDIPHVYKKVKAVAELTALNIIQKEKEENGKTGNQ